MTRFVSYYSSQVTFTYIVLYTINIVSKQLYSDNMIHFVSSSAEVGSLLIHFR